MSDNRNPREEFRRSMSEVSLLSNDDPLRQSFEQRISGEDSWAEEEWWQLLTEHTALAEHVPRLFDADAPADLHTQLLEIPHREPATPSRSKAHRLQWVLAVAAAVLVVLGIGVARRAEFNTRLRTVARLAADNHRKHVDEESDFAVAPTEILEKQLASQLKFNVVIPTLEDSLKLIGGRKCKIGTQPVAYTLWRGAQAKRSLFQCPASELDLPREMAPTIVHTRSAPSEPVQSVRIWSKDGRAYLLVGE
ncbi:MAG: hypothetical protein IH991_02005 [Planctomycetes bacterium]|nr:hypothetical protein [Planctomycetota bacterium]